MCIKTENSGVKCESPIESSKDGPAKLQTFICYPALSHVECCRVSSSRNLLT